MVKSKKKKVNKTHFYVTRHALDGLLAYFDMYGVDSMKFKRRGFAEDLENFGPIEVHPPESFHCCKIKGEAHGNR